MARARNFARHSPRIDVRRAAALVDSEGREISVTVLDVSSGGFRMHLEDVVKIGEFVTLRVDRGEEFPAQIAWALGSEAGGVFAEPVDCEQFR